MTNKKFFFVSPFLNSFQQKSLNLRPLGTAENRIKSVHKVDDKVDGIMRLHPPDPLSFVSQYENKFL